MCLLGEFKIICRDLIGIGVIGLVAVCVGLFADQFREAPLSLVYSPKAVRLQEAVANLGGNTLFPSESASLASSGTFRYLELASFREVVEMKTKGIILDARPGIFHQLGHVPGAISISREEFEADYAVHRSALEKDKSLLIAVYCSDSSCEDSQLVADALVKLGYTQVFVFKGGWSEWTGAGFPEEKAEDVK
jgi:rhodanese-related sulfurtransferase